MVKVNPIDEARRYMENAREILSEKAGKKGVKYSDPKYVKMAANTAWDGVLIALDAALHVSDNHKPNQMVDIKDIFTASSTIDIGLAQDIKEAYDLLHKTLGYDGVLNYLVVQESLKCGEILINWCEARVPKKKKQDNKSHIIQ